MPNCGRPVPAPRSSSNSSLNSLTGVSANGTGNGELSCDKIFIPLDENERILSLQMALKCSDLGHVGAPGREGKGRAFRVWRQGETPVYASRWRASRGPEGTFAYALLHLCRAAAGLPLWRPLSAMALTCMWPQRQSCSLCPMRSVWCPAGVRLAASALPLGGGPGGGVLPAGRPGAAARPAHQPALRPQQAGSHQEPGAWCIGRAGWRLRVGLLVLTPPQNGFSHNGLPALLPHAHPPVKW